MALFKIFGNFASGNTTLPTSATQGFCYFDKNTGKFYIDTSTTATPALNVDRLALNANKADDLNIVGTIDVSTGNKNLNNYTTPGRYYIPYLFYKTGGTGINPTGYSLSNCPVSISPLLESQSNTRTQAELQIFANNSIIIQIFTGFDALTKVIERYIRIYHNAWGIWLRMTLPTTETGGKFLTYDTNTNKYSFVTVDASNVTYDQTSINNNETVEFLSDGNIELTTTEEAINFLLDEMTYSILDINNILDNALLFDETADGYPQHYLTGDPEDDYQVATKHYVDQAFASNDAMIFKGTLAGAATTTYTPAAERGHTYKVSTAGLINGEKVEIGDMLICITDETIAATSSNVNTIKNNWAIIQTNIDGAVTGPSSATDNAVALFNGTTGKIIKNSAKTITTAIPAAASTSATIPTSNAVWSAITGASGYGKTGTVTSVQVQATAPVVSSSSASASTSLNTTISLANGYGDTKNPYAAKTPHYVLAGPSSGTATAVPTFRALVAADIPSLGNLTNDGKISTTATIANGDKLVIVDSDSTAASKITGSSITFDGSTETKALTQKGTWKAFVAPELSIYNSGTSIFYIKTDISTTNYQTMIYGYIQGNGYQQYVPIHVDFQAYNYNASDLLECYHYDATNAVGEISIIKGSDGFFYFKVVPLKQAQTFKVFIYLHNNNNTVNHAISSSTTAPTINTEVVLTKVYGLTSRIRTTTAPSSSSTDNYIPTSKAVWSAISGASGYGKTGTVTSVRVQATSPVVSSSNAAATATLDTTISLANAYGDTKNPYGTKTANYILAGPSSGDAAAPTFRKLVAADLPAIYYANIQTTSAATYNTTPEMATLKLNGNTSATAASTSNVTLIYDTTLQALNFVFA